LFLCPFAFLLFSCVGTRHLKDGENLLYRQQIKGNKNVSKEELSQFYLQEPNRRILFFPYTPYVSFYYSGLKRYDKTKFERKKAVIESKFDKRIASRTAKNKRTSGLEKKKKRKVDRKINAIENGNFLMRLGESLSILDSAKIDNTVQQMDLFLKTKGYFNAEVEYEVSVSERLASIEYTVKENNPYTIDSLITLTGDSLVAKLLWENKDAGFLIKGQNYDQHVLSSERDRITTLLKNNGYYDFRKLYVNFDIDSTLGMMNVAIKTIIKTPPNRNYHKVFKIDTIFFTTDAQLQNPNLKRITYPYLDITYRFYEKNYSKRILNRRIFIRPGDYYSIENTVNTQQQLANMDVFKFININYDTTGGKFIANIYSSPLDRYQWSNELGINVTQGFPGPFYNLSFKKRNLFKGLENFELSGRIGVEGIAAATNVEAVYRSIEAGGNVSLTLPQFVLPVSDAFKAKIGKVNPKTVMRTGFSFTDRPEYNRSTFNISNTYTWEGVKNNRFRFSISDLNFINSKLTSDFESRLDTLQSLGNNLKNSFEPSFVSSMIFTVVYNRNNYGTYQEKSSFLRILAESGGTTLNITGTKLLDDIGLEYYKFLKFGIDYRKHQPFDSKIHLAYRFRTGIAVPYSSIDILPYEKNYFIGGSSSIRAWRPRRLGPGSFKPKSREGYNVEKNGYIDYSIEQPGEIILESTIELRRRIAGVISSAVFLDFGNIWVLDKDGSREGAQFKANRFYKEIAVGTGFGLRFDFSFLVLRFDAGVKVIDPARDTGDRFVLDHARIKGPFGINKEPVILNIGVGYPF